MELSTKPGYKQVGHEGKGLLVDSQPSQPLFFTVQGSGSPWQTAALILNALSISKDFPGGQSYVRSEKQSAMTYNYYIRSLKGEKALN